MPRYTRCPFYIDENKLTISCEDVCRSFDSMDEKWTWMDMYCDTWDWMKCPHAADISEAYRKAEEGDVMAIENTMQYRGLYHVLGGVISPMDGIGPSDLQIESLVERVKQGGVDEVILALSPTMEGDTTNYYIYRKLEDMDVKVTVIARGIAQNDELQYTDEVTLGRALAGRIPFGQ